MASAAERRQRRRAPGRAASIVGVLLPAAVIAISAVPAAAVAGGDIPRATAVSAPLPLTATTTTTPTSTTAATTTSTTATTTTAPPARTSAPATSTPDAPPTGAPAATPPSTASPTSGSRNVTTLQAPASGTAGDGLPSAGAGPAPGAVDAPAPPTRSPTPSAPAAPARQAPEAVDEPPPPLAAGTVQPATAAPAPPSPGTGGAPVVGTDAPPAPPSPALGGAASEGDEATRPAPGGGAAPSGPEALVVATVVLAALASWSFLRRRRGAAPGTAPAGATGSFVVPPRRRLPGRATAAAWAVVWLGIAAALVEMGRLALYRPALALVLACAVLACVLAATDPLALGTFTVLAVWIIERVSAGGIDMSGSDTVLTAGAVAALPFVPWNNPGVRKVITAVVAFEAALFVTVLVHPSLPGLFEWGHRLFLTGGGVVVGAALAHHGRARTALRAFVAVSALVGAAAVLASAASGFSPAQVLGYHKNFIGSMMVAALALSYLAPRWTGFSAHELVPVKAACAGGLLASQSRGAIVALLVGLLVASARSSNFRSQSARLFLVLVPLATFAFFSLRSQVEQPGQSVSTSITERERYRDQGLEAWRASPATGQGMRFFESSESSLDSDPHNVIVASLSETGIVGLLALLGLVGTTVAVTWRVPTGLGVAAVVVMTARFTHGLFDIYWVAGTQVLPWLIVGMALGEPAGERSGPGASPEGDARLPGRAARAPTTDRSGPAATGASSPTAPRAAIRPSGTVGVPPTART